MENIVYLVDITVRIHRLFFFFVIVESNNINFVVFQIISLKKF